MNRYSIQDPNQEAVGIGKESESLAEILEKLLDTQDNILNWLNSSQLVVWENDKEVVVIISKDENGEIHYRVPEEIYYL